MATIEHRHYDEDGNVTVTTHEVDDVAPLDEQVADLRSRLDKAAAASVTGEAAKLQAAMKDAR